MKTLLAFATLMIASPAFAQADPHAGHEPKKDCCEHRNPDGTRKDCCAEKGKDEKKMACCDKHAGHKAGGEHAGHEMKH